MNTLVKKRDLLIQKAEKGNKIVIHDRSDYISKLTKISKDASKSKRVNIEERKALNRFINLEERIIRLLTNLQDQFEVSEKEKKVCIFIRF